MRYHGSASRLQNRRETSLLQRISAFFAAIFTGPSQTAECLFPTAADDSDWCGLPVAFDSPHFCPFHKRIVDRHVQLGHLLVDADATGAP